MVTEPRVRRVSGIWFMWFVWLTEERSSQSVVLELSAITNLDLIKVFIFAAVCPE